MKIKLNLESAHFWFREFRIPLFWITNQNSNTFSRDFIVFYKNQVVHVYTLNNREIKEDKKGFKFFSQNKNVLQYGREIENTARLIKVATTRCKSLDVRKLTERELKEQFFEMIALLTKYSNLYFQTEPIRLTSIDANEKKFKKTIQKLGKLRFSLREKGEFIYRTIFGKLIGEISRRTKIPFSRFFFFDYGEIKDLFKGKFPNFRSIQKRMKGYAYVVDNNKNEIITGTDFKKVFQKIAKRKIDQWVIRGRVAMKGFAKGKVRLILHDKLNIKKDIAKFRKGEILVTEMTRPDTVLACKKTAAIVTDEGGLTCHAAIVAREFKIPCIVGTKVVTQILKTGDVVEVDAEKGIVRIIKKARRG